MNKTIINSIDNKLVKSVKKLYSDRKYRLSTNLFVCDGYRIVKHMMTNGIEIRNIIVRADCKYISEFSKCDNLVFLSNSIFDRISDLKNADGIMCICIKPKPNFVLTATNYVIFNKIQNPNNLAGMIRTCQAFDIAGIVITNDSVDYYHPSVIRGSMGSSCTCNLKVVTDFNQAINLFNTSANNYCIYATGLTSNATSINQVKFKKPCVIVFGNEGNGLKDIEIKKCNQCLKIPINDKIDSLNVNVSCGIILYKLINGD
jgi:TrmH family RNA methyltransferase